MLKKQRSLQYLESIGCNVHEYEIPDSEAEFWDICKRYKKCTIRFDSLEHEGDNLPFYILDTGIIEDGEYASLESKKLCSSIWSESIAKHCKLIVANGLKYDNIQTFNLVAKFDKSGEFYCEVSELKIPLRKMYNFKLLSVHGSVDDDIQQWFVLEQKYGIDKRLVKDVLLKLWGYEIYDRFFEVTLYPIQVGKLKDYLIFWQIQ